LAHHVPQLTAMLDVPVARVADDQGLARGRGQIFDPLRLWSPTHFLKVLQGMDVVDFDVSHVSRRALACVRQKSPLQFRSAIPDMGWFLFDLEFQIPFERDAAHVPTNGVLPGRGTFTCSPL